MAFVEVSGSRFQAIEGPSVLTRRNFGLTRGKSLQEAAQILHNLNGADGEEPQQQQQQDIESAVSGKRKNSVTFGQGGLGDKSSNIWEWPLGEPQIVSTDTTFEATIPFKPFNAKEISATVMGTELVLQCATDNKRKSCIRELTRSYQLPLNLDPTSVRFFVSNESARLMITGDKLLPLKLAIAFFLPEYADNDDRCSARE